MFSILADFLTISLTILFPVFASYKALEASDPAQLTPWLTYWVVFSLATCAESVISFFYLDWIPFYAWARLGVHLYLLLPGESQGAGFIYNRHVKPFLLEHERSIEGFISHGHAQLKISGLDYLNQGFNYIRYNVLGQPRPAPIVDHTAAQTYANYAQSLLARFTLPSGSGSTIPRAPNVQHSGNNDIYTLLSSAISTATSSPSATSSAARVAPNQRIIPASISDPTDRASYISATRARLRALLVAVDREEEEEAAVAANEHNSRNRGALDDGLAYGSVEPGRPSAPRKVSSGSGSRPFRKSGSELDFESINHEDLSASGSMGRVAAGAGVAAAGAGNWGSWVWGRKEATAAATGGPGSSEARMSAGGSGDTDTAAAGLRAVSSSGVEARRMHSSSGGGGGNTEHRHRHSSTPHSTSHHRRDS